MYGFGDSSEPLAVSIDLVEDAVVNFIQDIVHPAFTIDSQGLEGSKSTWKNVC
jgi:hypothetical protein